MHLRVAVRTVDNTVACKWSKNGHWQLMLEERQKVVLYQATLEATLGRPLVLSPTARV